MKTLNLEHINCYETKNWLSSLNFISYYEEERDEWKKKRFNLIQSIVNSLHYLETFEMDFYFKLSPDSVIKYLSFSKLHELIWHDIPEKDQEVIEDYLNSLPNYNPEKFMDQEYHRETIEHHDFVVLPILI